MPTLLVIPTDPIEVYEQKGLCKLKEYYNPTGYFDTVYAVSPWEKEERFAHGMHILPCTWDNFKKLLFTLKPDVIRAYGGYDACELACKNKIPGIPVVVSVHDTNPKLLFDSIVHADMVLCMSSVVASLVEKKGVATEKIFIMPNRLDYDIFCPVENADYSPILKYGIQQGGKHILCVGRLSPQKNLDTVIQALTHLPAEYSAVFMGRGNKDFYQELAREHGVFERCTWIDHIPNTELPLWHSWADCFCVPSLWEGFGVVFIEAAASGNPVITSNIAPMNEYLEHNVSAYLVDAYKNPEAVACAIRTVCEDSSLHAMLAKNGREAMKRFDRAVVDTMEVEHYKNALALASTTNICIKKNVCRVITESAYMFALLRKQCPSPLKRAYRALKLLSKARPKEYVYGAKIFFAELYQMSKETCFVWRDFLKNKNVGTDQWSADNVESLKIHNDFLTLEWKELAATYVAYTDRVVHTIEHISGNVLEVGAGAGNMTRWIVAKDSVHSVVAVESSPIAFKALQNGAFDFFEKVTPVLDKLNTYTPSRGNVFDTVVLSEIIEHVSLSEELAFLKNIRSALKISEKDCSTKFVVSTPIGFMPDPFHIRGFSKSMFIHHIEKHYGQIKGIYYGEHQQIAWGFFK